MRPPLRDRRDRPFHMPNRNRKFLLRQRKPPRQLIRRIVFGRNPVHSYLRVCSCQRLKDFAQHVQEGAFKWSTRRNKLVSILTSLRRRGIDIRKAPEIIDTFKLIDEALLWEDPTKAPLLSCAQMKLLLHEKDPTTAVTLSLMLPSGARFADVARIRTRDVSLTNDQLMIRVRQQKNIRRRGLQRWLTVTVPQALLPYLRCRLLQAPPEETIIRQTYRQFLNYIKLRLGPRYTTYSIRRSVFEILRQRLDSLEQIQRVTL
eukprot:PhM_4_TR18715/c1_g3_i11/m.62398